LYSTNKNLRKGNDFIRKVYFKSRTNQPVEGCQRISGDVYRKCWTTVGISHEDQDREYGQTRYSTSVLCLHLCRSFGWDRVNFPPSVTLLKSASVTTLKMHPAHLYLAYLSLPVTFVQWYPFGL